MKKISEPTEKVNVYNYPTESKNTFSYITLEYTENSKITESTPIYFYTLSSELKALATIIGEAQTAIINLITKNTNK